MPSFENQVLIERPVFDVFKYAGDFTNDSNWRSVERIGITSGDPIRPGTMVAMTRRIAGAKGFVNADVVEYDRNKKIELKGSFWGVPFTQTILFEHRGQQTNLRESVNIKTSWRIWLFAFFSLTLAGSLKKDLKNLKELLDAHGDRKAI